MGRVFPDGGGDVVGPANSAANEIVLFDGATGKLLKRPGTSHGFPPAGTTAQRPGTPSAGMLRYNVSTHQIEYYSGSLAAWVPVSVANSGTAIQNSVMKAADTTGRLISQAGTGHVFLAQGTTAQRPGTPSAGMIRYNTSDNMLEFYDGSSWIQLGTGGAGADTMYIFASLAGNANSTTGQLQWFNVNTSNPGGVLEQTSSGDPGIDNGGSNPFCIPAAATLTDARLVCAHAAVSQGTAGGAMTARFDVYSAAYSSRSLLTSLDFSISSAGVFNNLGGNNFQTSALSSIGQAISAGDLLGVQFTNRSANNNEINAIGGCYLALRLEF